MTSEYEDIYNVFLGLISGYDLGELSKRDAYELMGEWMETTIFAPKVEKLFVPGSVNIDEDMEQVKYELNRPINDYTDKKFVERLLAYGMVIGWLSPKYKNELLTEQIYGTKESQFYSQAQHMQRVHEMYEKAKSELDKDWIRDRGYSTFILRGN